jgi:hypothetical protein
MNDIHPPRLDSPYGPNVWQQPARESILIDDVHAVMSRHTFEQLAEYSASIPSGAHPGKLWRRANGKHDPNHKGEPIWLLCWYGPLADLSKVSINYRTVLLV